MDVMVLGKAGFAEVVAALAPVQDVLRREVNPTVMTPAEFAKRRKAGDGFATTLLREPKLWLIGDDHDLG